MLCRIEYRGTGSDIQKIMILILKTKNVLEHCQSLKLKDSRHYLIKICHQLEEVLKTLRVDVATNSNRDRPARMIKRIL